MSRFRVRVTGVRLRQRVELAARAGRRRDAGHPRRHVRTVRSLDGDPRPPRSGLAGQPGGGAPARPEGAGRGGPARVEPRHVSRRSGADRRTAATPDDPVRGSAPERPRARRAASSCCSRSSFLVPDLTPPPTQPPPVELLRGRIVEFLPATRRRDGSGRPHRGRSTGRSAGQTVDGFLQGRPAQQDLPRYQVGDEVVVNASTEPDATFIAVADLYRIPALALLLGAVRGRGDGRRRLARRPLADRPRADARRHRQDRRPADPRRARPGLGRDRRRRPA